MQRLDSPGWTAFHKWSFYCLLVGIWGYLGYQTIFHGDRVWSFIVCFGAASILLLWWLATFKSVWVDRNTIVIRGMWKEAMVPFATLHHINVWKGRIAYITLVFKPRSPCGRCVRIIPRYSRIDQIAKYLRGRIERRNSPSTEPAREPADDIAP